MCLEDANRSPEEITVRRASLESMRRARNGAQQPKPFPQSPEVPNYEFSNKLFADFQKLSNEQKI